MGIGREIGRSLALNTVFITIGEFPEKEQALTLILCDLCALCGFFRSK
jgi:hypothetical protein